MRYIEVADGISVKVSEIEAVVKKDDFTSEVVTHQNTYSSTFPYDVLVELLEMRHTEDAQELNSDPEEKNILKEIGTPAW